MSTADSTSTITSEPIPEIPGPWILTGRAFIFIGVIASTPNALPDWTYHDLEAKSSFALPENGAFTRGFGMMMIIRYDDSLAGPYDELLFSPGYFEYPFEEKDGRISVKKAVRITHIYVSQEKACMNGRKNWNIPKHIAHFDFQESPNGKSTQITVTPTTHNTPIFSATLTTAPFTPSFPLDTKWADPFNWLMELVAPALPSGLSTQPELTGTDSWCRLVPRMRSRNTHIVTLKVDNTVGGFFERDKVGYWPSWGFDLRNIRLEFPIGKHWTLPQEKSKDWLKNK